ncbi:MAG: hypothetical protein HZA50_09850 [Planctomycetes bacterium]|nr:hypothetical protein [Planctomycetota bacterium]
MKNVALMLAVVAVLGLVVGTVMAQQRNAPGGVNQPTTLEGKVAKAVDDKGVLVVTPKQGREGETRKFVTNDKTAVTIDEKEAKVADLKEGMAVTVTYSVNQQTLVAAKIEAKKAEDKKVTDAPPK